MTNNSIYILFIDSTERRRNALLNVFFPQWNCAYWDFKWDQVRAFEDSQLPAENNFTMMMIHYGEHKSLPYTEYGAFQIWYSGKKGMKQDIPATDLQFTRPMLEDQFITKQEAQALVQSNVWLPENQHISLSFLKSRDQNLEIALPFLNQLMIPQSLDWTTIHLPQELDQFYSDWNYFVKEVAKLDQPLSFNDADYQELYKSLRDTLLGNE